MNFTNKAILCDTWEQMEHLARIAEKQGKRTTANYFTPSTFATEKYFYANESFYLNCVRSSVLDCTILTYTQFINQSDTPSVYGC